MLRGESLAHCNIMEYFVDTYEADMEKRYMHSANDEGDDADDIESVPGCSLEAYQHGEGSWCS